MLLVVITWLVTCRNARRKKKGLCFGMGTGMARSRRHALLLQLAQTTGHH